MTHDDLRPRIENSDRGITLNRSLAWTMLIAILSGAFWAGQTITALQGMSDRNAKAISEIVGSQALDRAESKADLAMIIGRIGTIEQQQARADERFSNILSYMARIDARLERMEGQP